MICTPIMPNSFPLRKDLIHSEQVWVSLGSSKDVYMCKSKSESESESESENESESESKSKSKSNIVRIALRLEYCMNI